MFVPTGAAGSNLHFYNRSKVRSMDGSVGEEGTFKNNPARCHTEDVNNLSSEQHKQFYLLVPMFGLKSKLK